jgi:hypothetical protein
MWDSVSPLLLHGEKMHNRFLFQANGDTPLDSALWRVLQTMQPLSEKRKVILLITDGRPDNIEAAKYAIRAASQMGYELYGIGIVDESISRLLPDGRSRTINTIEELAPAMFSLLQKALLRPAAGEAA